MLDSVRLDEAVINAVLRFDEKWDRAMHGEAHPPDIVEFFRAELTSSRVGDEKQCELVYGLLGVEFEVRRSLATTSSDAEWMVVPDEFKECCPAAVARAVREVRSQFESRLSDGSEFREYKVVRHIASGGMGSVYLVRNTDQDLYALKVLRPDKVRMLDELTHDQWITRFKRESRLLKELHQDDETAAMAPTVYGSGLDEQTGLYFIVMDYVSGSTLKEHVKEHGPIELTEAISIVDKIARWIELAHAKGLVHRDLSPSNVMLTDGGRVKIIDFGIARLQAELVTADGQGIADSNPHPALTSVTRVVGTPGYIAPERIHNPRVATASVDVYGLAALFLYALSGKSPRDTDVIGAHIWRPDMDGNAAFPRPLSHLLADMELSRRNIEEISSILRSGLGESPKWRTRSCRDFADALLKLRNDVLEEREGRNWQCAAVRSALSCFGVICGAVLAEVLILMFAWNRPLPDVSFVDLIVQPSGWAITMICVGIAARAGTLYIPSVDQAHCMQWRQSSPSCWLKLAIEECRRNLPYAARGVYCGMSVTIVTYACLRMIPGSNAVTVPMLTCALAACATIPLERLPNIRVWWHLSTGFILSAISGPLSFLVAALLGASDWPAEAAWASACVVSLLLGLNGPRMAVRYRTGDFVPVRQGRQRLRHAVNLLLLLRIIGGVGIGILCWWLAWAAMGVPREYRLAAEEVSAMTVAEVRVSDDASAREALVIGLSSKPGGGGNSSLRIVELDDGRPVRSAGPPLDTWDPLLSSQPCLFAAGTWLGAATQSTVANGDWGFTAWNLDAYFEGLRRSASGEDAWSVATHVDDLFSSRDFDEPCSFDAAPGHLVVVKHNPGFKDWPAWIEISDFLPAAVEEHGRMFRKEHGPWEMFEVRGIPNAVRLSPAADRIAICFYDESPVSFHKSSEVAILQVADLDVQHAEGKPLSRNFRRMIRPSRISKIGAAPISLIAWAGSDLLVTVESGKDDQAGPLLHVWDVAAGVARDIQHSLTAVSHLKTSTDGTMIAVIGQVAGAPKGKNTVRVWESRTGSERSLRYANFEGEPIQLSFAGQDSRLFVMTRDGRLIVFTVPGLSKHIPLR